MQITADMLSRQPAGPSPAETRALTHESFGLLAPIGLVSDRLLQDELEISPETALLATSVYAAVSIIASALGTLPIEVIDRKTREPRPDHPAQLVLDHPNDEMTRSDVVECLGLNLLTTGNGYVYVKRDRFFDPAELFPLQSLHTWPQRKRGRLDYLSVAADRTFRLGPANVIHVRNMSSDGLCGISPLRCGAGAVGLTLALDRFAAKFFTNGANVGNVIELPAMDQPALEAFKASWKQQYQGLDNAHRTAAAPGLKVHKMGYNPRDSQAIESRKFQLAEVARVYQVPPHMLGDLDKATFSNIEEQGREFAQRTLRRWTVKMEEAFEHTLLSAEDQRTHAIRFDLADLTRGTFKEQVEAVMAATGGAPVYTQNDGRRRMGMQPIQGGDVLLSNLNQAPAAKRTEALVRSLAGNFATRETNAIRRAAKQHAEQPEAFRAWADDFYDGHALRLRAAFDGSGLEASRIDRLVAEHRTAAVAAFEVDGLDALLEAVPGRTADGLAEAALAA